MTMRAAGGWALGLCWFVAIGTGTTLRAAAQTGRNHDSVALVVALQGKATVRGAARAAGFLLLGDEVFVGQQITLPKGKLILAWHKNGPRYAVASGAKVKVLGNGLQPLAGPRPTLLPARTDRTAYRAGDARPPREGVLTSSTRGNGSGSLSTAVLTRMNAPLGGTAAARPQFGWACVPPADTVRIEVWDGKENHRLWTMEVKNGATTADYPADKPALTPGKLYIWKLIVPSETASDTTSESQFWVLRPETTTYLEGLRAEVTAHSEDSEAQIIFLRKLWDVGLFEEAANEADTFAKAQPDNAALQNLAARLKKVYENLANCNLNALEIDWDTSVR